MRISRAPHHELRRLPVRGWSAGRWMFGIAVAAVVALTASGCTSTKEPAHLTGKVVLTQTLAPLSGALVRVSGHTESTVSQADGSWSLDVDLNTRTETVTIDASLAGYTAANTSAYVERGTTVAVPTLTLVPQSTSGGGTDTTTVVVPPHGNVGPPSSVVLQVVTPSTKTIGVHGSGDAEVALLQFQVFDAQGRALDLTRRATLQAVISNPLDAAEKISPDSAVTDANGTAVFVVQAGTKAGAVQVQCSVKGTDIVSNPVPVVIHGAQPDSSHFALGFSRINMPGRVAYGLTDPVTAYVGDRYANPVRPNAGVYFTSTHGIIAGSGFTDDLGRATVLIESAQPLPADGFATVSARTSSWQNKQIETTGRLLMSGPTQLSVTPSTFSLGIDESQDFLVTLSDDLGHPLVGNTSLVVSATKGTLSGDTSVLLPDTQSSGWTQFYVTLTNDPTATASPRPIPRTKDGLPLVHVNMHPTLNAPKGGAKAVTNGVGISVTFTVTSENGNSQVSVRGDFH